MAQKRSYESVKYNFNAGELRELGEVLARDVQSVFDLRGQKATVSAELAAAIKSAEKRVSEVTRKINHGYELRDVEVIALFETPRPGLKQIVRLDNNEVLREEAMTTEEMQASFGFDTAAKD